MGPGVWTTTKHCSSPRLKANDTSCVPDGHLSPGESTTKDDAAKVMLQERPTQKDNIYVRRKRKLASLTQLGKKPMHYKLQE